MRARAEVNGAISVLNAAATGFGAAIAISAKVSAEAEPSSAGIDVSFDGVDPGDTRLVEAAAGVISEELGWRGGWRLRVTSNLPPRKGLKTSSAVSNALIASMCLALGSEPNPTDVLRMGVLASRRAHVTVTGALDDAAASLLGGFVEADNDAGVIEVHRQVPSEGVDVIIGIPGDEIDKSGVVEGCVRAADPGRPEGEGSCPGRQVLGRYDGQRPDGIGRPRDRIEPCG